MLNNQVWGNGEEEAFKLSELANYVAKNLKGV
jgi:hypothetical protein